jgi:F-type H+-transporting ATPase subunit epsilon
MKLQILTPEKTVFDGEAESVLVPGAAGSFEVLKGHAPILSSLAVGDVRVLAEKKELHFKVGSGFFEFSHENAVVMVESAEPHA